MRVQTVERKQFVQQEDAAAGERAVIEPFFKLRHILAALNFHDRPEKSVQPVRGIEVRHVVHGALIVAKNARHALGELGLAVAGRPDFSEDDFGSPNPELQFQPPLRFVNQLFFPFDQTIHMDVEVADALPTIFSFCAHGFGVIVYKLVERHALLAARPLDHECLFGLDSPLSRWLLVPDLSPTFPFRPCG